MESFGLNSNLWEKMFLYVDQVFLYSKTEKFTTQQSSRTFTATHNVLILPNRSFSN